VSIVIRGKNESGGVSTNRKKGEQDRRVAARFITEEIGV